MPADLKDPPIEPADPVEASDPGQPTSVDPGDGGRDPVEWVTVATFALAPQAQIARLMLESEGVECVLFDENLVATDWLMTNAVGGIKLQVPVTESVLARQLLARKNAPAPADPDPAPSGELSAEDAAGGPDTETCPACGSENVTHGRFSRRVAFASILLLGLPLPFLARGYRCDDCGHAWKPTRPQ